MIINPKGTAAWLIENTSLTFEQIADFCDVHYMEIEAMANEEVSILLSNPIDNHQLSIEEINRCEKDENAILKLSELVQNLTIHGKKKTKYKPLAKRNLIPCAILFLITKHPQIKDNQISSLIGTTKSTVAKIRDGSYKGFSGISPKDPVLAGFCTHAELNKIVELISKQNAEKNEK